MLYIKCTLALYYVSQKHTPLWRGQQNQPLATTELHAFAHTAVYILCMHTTCVREAPASLDVPNMVNEDEFKLRPFTIIFYVFRGLVYNLASHTF